MKVVLFGPQGAGKGTAAKMLSEKFKIPHIDMGGIFRQAAEEGTALGIKARDEYWGKGKLVPDEITIGLFKERMKKPDVQHGFVLDGYPRRIAQAEALDETTDVDFLIDIEVPEKVTVQRLSGRRICKNCKAIYHVTNIPPKVQGICDKCGGELYQRPDDKPQEIKVRLKAYKEETKPLFKHYGDRIIEVDGTGTPEEVFEKVLEVVWNK